MNVIKIITGLLLNNILVKFIFKKKEIKNYGKEN